MSSISSDQTEQYANSKKLAARGRLYSEYSIAKTPWFSWAGERLPLQGGDAVLDIGCGPGWFWSAVANTMPEGLHLTLADQSAGMVDEALQRCTGLPFASVTGQKADVAALPFADNSFDTVIAMHMLYHLPDPAVGIAEMFRVLKPGGSLVVSTNGVNNMRQLYGLTTALGSGPIDPSAVAFGFDKAEQLLRAQFGNVTQMVHPGGLRVTEPEDVFLALTSYPPGDRASVAELEAFQEAIDQAFAHGNGVLAVDNEVGLFVSRKPDV